MNYNEFIESKRHTAADSGIKCQWLPEGMFDFQKYITEYAVNKGRCGVFLDTGLGKTVIELATAVNYVRSTNRPVLILTPLAVAFQFIREAEKFGIDDIEYSKDGSYRSKIVVCNYERLKKFNPDDFDCVILDESSILKNFDGAIKTEVTAFMRKVKYRFLFTATPSPNDFVELGTGSEALGYLGYSEMLTKFFSNNENNVVSTLNIGNKWYLKPHAKTDFFRWVSGWSISMRKPSDLGFDDGPFILPELKINYNEVKNVQNQIVNGQILLFNRLAHTQSEVRNEQKQTIEERCEKAVELAQGHEYSVYWCNFNAEGDLIEKLDTGARQIHGSMCLEEKEELLLAFYRREIKKLVTKPKITAFGLNWQHCNHTVFFPTFSYEQWYQAIRRFYRFGQKRNVTADMVFSDGQKRVLDSLIQKTEKANELFSSLNANLHQNFDIKSKEFNRQIIHPIFLNYGKTTGNNSRLRAV